MKRLIFLLLVLLLVPVVLSGQTRAKNGLIIGRPVANMDIIDSTKIIDGVWTFFNSGNPYVLVSADEDTVAIGVVAWMLTDTIILGAFSAIDSFNTSFIYGSFYNNGSDTLVITEMMCVLQGTTPSISVDIEWHATIGSGSAVGLNTTPPTITSITTGDSDVSFDNAQIPPGVFVWLKTPTIGTAPDYLSVTLLGYRKNITY